MFSNIMANVNNQKIFKFLDVFSYVILLVNVVAIPLFVDKNLINFYIIPKQYVFIGLVLINVVLFAVKIVLSKKLTYRRSVMDLPILGLLLISLAVSIFSVNTFDSFLGRGEYFVLNFFLLIFLATFYFLLVNILTTQSRWLGMVDALLYTGGATALLFLLKAIFKLDIISYIAPSAMNTIDKVNMGFGIWLIMIFLLAAGKLIKKNITVGKSLSYFFVALLAFVSLVMLSFNIFWWIILAGLVLLLMIGISFVKDSRLGWVSALFAMTILVVVFIAFGTPRYLQAVVPAEVSLGFKPSWSISADTLFSGAKNFILGSGLGTFNVDYSKFRSVDFNTDSMAWSLRFSQPASSFFSLLAEGGIVFTLALIFLIIYSLGHVFNIWVKKGAPTLAQKVVDGLGDSGDFKIDVFLITVAWLVLSGVMCVVYYGLVLWWLWWLLLGLIITAVSFINADVIKTKVWEVDDTPQYSLTFSFVMIVVTAGLVMIGVWGGRLYMAERAYASALKSSDYETVESNLKTALFHRQNTDVYHVALAQVYLLRASEMVQGGSQDVQTISNYLAQAVNEARTATDISPRSVAIWENLAVMYENAAVLVPEAGEWAIKTWQKAKELEPTNPILSWRLGNNYAVAGNWEESVKNYQEAITLKKDYLDSYISLGRAFEQQNKVEDAVNIFKEGLSYGGNSNSAFLFDFGRLLYNRNKGSDRSDAEQLWLAAVKLQPNYSNALYSLGLLYENKDDKAAALQYYYKVKDLNPDNKDITTKIKSLVGGE
ncbi:MAG: hypothetical protein COU29_02235 [Candidatus Magasanikbacteria bacterium CG10_big_fil_rev_8_21_14_0_10_36_32]|uniref:Uncharacterized protein n=1 Tax=Candidatus Magasanikbacteria bacterium CG10_big_fil_rev_8_21_14_0_10_36_32 TaxID=1974646 RepID=A0A2M6W726_9BACT|nr:MAG: hypothetical protein COU29_02235 [Candidatus Magasanikbacteria bacterium CG10_big_fil_rev_8_21_14_0_10_36_32]